MGRSRFLGGTNIEKNARDLRVYMAEESGVPYQVMVSDDDTTPGYLSAKITSTDASVVITVLNDGADEDLDLSVAVYVAAEIATHASNPNAHHNQSHVLATASGLGADHTVSGLTAGHVLRATGATTAAFGALQATDLAVHVLATTSGLGSQHSVSGLTAGQVLRATGSTTAAFASLQATDLPSHVLATNTALGSQHTISGATAGHVLRASGATTAAFAQLQHSDLGGVGANDHHNQSHVLATTSALGPDHTVSGLTAGQVLKATGATAARFIQLLHSELGSIGANDHHNQSHVLASTSGLGADHTVSGLTARQVLIATGSTTALFRALEDADIPASIARDSEVTSAISTHASDANAHHNRSHAITSSSDHTVTGAALDVVGLTATNVLGILTPSSAPGAASALLKSDSSGYLTLVRYIANGAAGTARVLQWQTGGSARWDLRANSTAESGSNAGSDLQLFAYSDAGAFLSTAMQVTRATGYVNFPGTAVQATALGIGVSPSVPIHVSSTSNEMIRLSHSSSGSPFIAFYTDSLRHGYLQANTNNTVYLAAEYGSLVFQTGAAGTASTRVTIEDDGDVVIVNNVTIGGDLTITTTGDQGDRFIMENSSVSGSSVFYDFNDTDRDAGSTGAFELGFYRDANNITQVRMSKEVFEVIIRSGGTYRFPLEVRAQQVILAELPTSNPGIIGALYRSGNDVLIST
jgi:hypothetical protein